LIRRQRNARKKKRIDVKTKTSLKTSFKKTCVGKWWASVGYNGW
jgi:hypothetical protein